MNFLLILLFVSAAFARAEKIFFKLPDYTLGDRVYITGDTAQLCNWNPNCLELQKEGDKYSINVEVPAGGFQFKITRGDWTSQAADKNGIPLRNFQYKTSTATRKITFEVPHWQDQIGRFHSDLVLYEIEDRAGAPGQILLVGSSSARLWKTINADMFPFPVFSRGAGGAHIEDLILYRKRMVLKYAPEKVIVYAGENDLAGDENIEVTFAQMKTYLSQLRKALPQTEFYCLSIKPSPTRSNLIPKIMKYNSKLQTLSQCKYIDTFSSMFSSAGELRLDIWREGFLHLNERGYQLWADIIKEAL